MTAYQRAAVILQRRGPMEPAEFGRAMWPVLHDVMDSTAFSTAVGNFLAGMVRLGLARKVGRKYGERIGRERL